MSVEVMACGDDLNGNSLNGVTIEQTTATDDPSMAITKCPKVDDRHSRPPSQATPQVITPPDSLEGSPLLNSRSSPRSISGTNTKNAFETTSSSTDSAFISVSTAFFPGVAGDSLPTDLILLSSESVFFYVHSIRLLSASANGFNQLVSDTMTAKNPGDPDPIVSLSESSNIINILLHTVYGVSCAHYAPSFEDLSRTVAVLPKYGLPIDVYLSPSTPLSTALSIHAPTSPLELYSLAASLDLYHLAVTASAHLLSLSPPLLSDECAVRMGPIYLKRLFVLHLGRTDTLKRLLLVPPRTHTPTGDCDYSEQKRVTRAWALASAYLLLDARADMGVGTIEAALLPLAGHAGCSMCKATLVERIKEVVLQWSSVKSTI